MIYLSLACYIGSLFLPALYFNSSGTFGTYGWSNRHEVWNGFDCFFNGLFAWIKWHFEVVANFCYLMAVIYTFKKKWKIASIFGASSILIGLETISLYWFPVINEEFIDLFAKDVFTGLGSGFYLWMFSMVLLFLIATSTLIKARGSKESFSPNSSD